MSATDLVAPIISGLFGAGGAGAFVAYIRDRRSDKAKGAVAEATVGIDIDIDRLGLIERQMAALEKAFDTERRSLLSTIEAERLESAKKDEKIAKLSRQVDEIQKALDLVKAELADRKPSEQGK